MEVCATKRVAFILLCALLLCVCAFGAAEEALPEHDESHSTVERPQDQPFFEQTDSPEEHLRVVLYDLYCEDCGRVIEEDVRREEIPEPHDWNVTRQEPTCLAEGLETRLCAACGAEETEALPKGGHLFSVELLTASRETGVIMGEGAYADRIAGRVTVPSTCTEEGQGVLLCLTCQAVSQLTVLPARGHTWGEWTALPPEDGEACVSDAIGVRRCQDCGLEETAVLSPAPGHQWVGVSYTAPTCTEPGAALRRCAVCGAEDAVESPALGHCYIWIDEKQPNGVTVSLYTCSVCGDVAQRRVKSAEQMHYNNVITSFGPMTRDLIGGGVWNRVTPLDLDNEGIFTYPLVASNQYTVGTATVLNENGVQMVTYRLNSNEITVHTESLVFYPDLEALRTGEHAVSVDFDDPVRLENYFGDDRKLLMSITLRADYDALDPGIQDFHEDEALVSVLSEMIN